ncbi:hypothetical protein ACFSYD_09075 [Paracoccus aerius]
MATVITARATIGTIICHRADWGRSAKAGWRPLGWAFQKASAQILVIEKIVSSPTSSATPATSHSPRSSDARTMTNLAQKPDSGGKPASEKAGMMNRAASSGAER